jgi:hypothetical protein
MFDGYMISCGIVKQEENIAVVNSLTVEELVNLPQQGTMSIIPMNKKCYLSMFEFTDNLAYEPPGNSTVRSGSGAIRFLDGTQFQQWIQGDSVESIEIAARNSFFPVVTYWDHRTWPRFPVLRPDDYLGLQAYCGVDEAPDAFKLNMQAVINSVPENYKHISLICQQFTSNLSLTQNIKALIPIFNDLARENPRITSLIVFTDQGRSTGLSDHPDLIQYWHQVLAGITGVPSMPDDSFEPQPLDQRVLQTLRDLRPKYPTPMGGRSGELANEGAFIHRLEGYGLERKDGGNVVFVPGIVDQNGNPIPLASDIVRTLSSGGWDVFEDAEGSCKVKDSVMSGPVIPDKFVAPVGTVEPPHSDMNILIFGYSSNVHRSDPLGLIIQFEVESQNPVAKIIPRLEDGSLPIEISFIPHNGQDGRYVRALSFKPTINGTFALSIEAFDSTGNSVKVMGDHSVTVSP